jgi:hypothetical protein
MPNRTAAAEFGAKNKPQPMPAITPVNSTITAAWGLKTGEETSQ